MLAWGVDGCRTGWVAAWIDPAGKCGFTIVERIEQLPALDAAMVFIDMPIGLPDSGHRGCDLAARKQLGRAWPRVFIGLRRPLLRYIGNYTAANDWAKSDGKGLARQAFAILPKIAEIDAIMWPARQDTFRESHPELVFQRLNGGVALASKHKPEGLRKRRELLAGHGFDAIDAWLGTLRGTGAKPDDLLDACVLAFAASGAMKEHARRVDCPEARDARGLRMEIWF